MRDKKGGGAPGTGAQEQRNSKPSPGNKGPSKQMGPAVGPQRIGPPLRGPPHPGDDTALFVC